MAKTLTTQVQKPTNATSSINDKALRSMADAIFKQLQNEGCEAKDIISVSSQLLGLVSDQIKESATAQ
jgi:N-acetylglucosamine kinase-like BadF-type ATPase